MTNRTLMLITPEGVRFRLRLAGPARRSLALIIDGVAIGAATEFVATAVHVVFGASGFGIGLQILTNFVLQLFYGMALEWFWRGQTLGKRLFHLRVHDAAGRPLAPAQVATRNLMRCIDGLFPCYLVGGAASLLSARFQRLGDRVAATVVVDESRPAELNLESLAPGKFNSLLASTAAAYRWRQSADPAEAKLLIAALLRRQELLPAARLSLYRDLRAYFEGRTSFPEEITAPLSDEQFLHSLAGILQPPKLKAVAAGGP